MVASPKITADCLPILRMLYQIIKILREKLAHLILKGSNFVPTKDRRTPSLSSLFPGIARVIK